MTLPKEFFQYNMDCNKSIFDAPIVNWNVFKYLLTHQAIFFNAPLHRMLFQYYSLSFLLHACPLYMFNSSLVQV